MMISKAHCLYLFLLLYGGAIIAIFIRAFPRRRLLEDHQKLQAGQFTVAPESEARKILLTIPRQTRALRELGKTIDNAPAIVRRRYRLFQVLNWVAIVLIVLLVVFSFTAHRVCGG
jgi:hypothetical protein